MNPSAEPTSIAHELSPLERMLLLSADDAGRIPFPAGTPQQVAKLLNALVELEQKRHVHRPMQHGYRPYHLTDSGKALKDQALAVRPQYGLAANVFVRPRLTWRKLLPAVLAALLLAAAQARARIGESPARLEARFGAPVKIENGMCGRDFQALYKHGGMTIVVHFLDEKSQLESYSNEGGETMSAEEIQRLLEVNRGGGRWKLTAETSSSKKWDLNSGEATATYRHGTRQLLEIRTSGWDRHVTNLAQHPAESADRVSERLKDF